MPTITDIKRRILELSPASFQEFCDSFLYKEGYRYLHGYGMKSGTGNTTKGNPDTYFRNKNGKYVFVVYTITQVNIFSKIKDDIEKCLDSSKTGIDISHVEKIICCHTSSNLSAGDDKKLHDYCEDNNIELVIYGIDEIANSIYNKYQSLSKDYLGLAINTGQFLIPDEFVKQYNNKIAAPLDTIFRYREKEKNELINLLSNRPVVIVSGKAGVGKTKLALQVSCEYASLNNYELLCIKNNNLGLFDDLVSVLEHNKRLLFFIDDVNELAQLNLVLEYIQNKELDIKIIATVRDYAKEDVIKVVNKNITYSEMQLSPFSDDEIKGFIEENLHILNEDYLKQIARISEGNPRIAYMAGKLAIDNNSIESIHDVSQLYDSYYDTYIDSTIGKNRELSIVSGILSVINAAFLDDLSAIKELLNNCGISIDEFKMHIFELEDIEVVEIRKRKVAALSDQCFSNYMLYYVFFHKKLLNLSSVLEIGYKHFRKGVIRSINTILNLYDNKNTRTYCKEEIIKVWNKFKNNGDECFADYVRDFHCFKPEEGFLLAQEELQTISEDAYNVYEVNFSKSIFDKRESILQLLSGYQYSDYLEYVISILLSYCKKNMEMLISGSKWLKETYGVNIHSHKMKYNTQIEIGKNIYKHILEGNVIAEAVGLEWANYCLSFTYHPSEYNRGNSVTIYTLPLRISPGVKEYRQECWNILMVLSEKVEWQKKIINFLDAYTRNMNSDVDFSILTDEVKNVEQIIKTINCNDISFMKIANRLLCVEKKLGIKYDGRLFNNLEDKEWKLYKVLEEDVLSSNLNYSEYKESRRNRIISFSKTITTLNIKEFVKTANRILSCTMNNHEVFEINEGLEMIINSLDTSLLLTFLDYYIQYGSNFNICPFAVLKRLNTQYDSKVLLAKLKENDFPQKNIWLFSFFDSLPNEKVNKEMTDELIIFFKDESDQNIKSSSFRNLRLLDKFIHEEQFIYSKVCSIIFEKREYNSFIVEIYFEHLFNEHIYSPDEILYLFRDNIELLISIYVYMLKFGRLIDYNGIFLGALLSKSEKILRDYAEYFWGKAIDYNDDDFHRTIGLWKTEKYNNYFNYLYEGFPNKEANVWGVISAFRYLLGNDENDSIIKQHQIQWLSNLIISNIQSKQISLIFGIIAELDDETRRFCIKILLENNKSYETFKAVQLFPHHWSGNGSFIPSYQKQIDFLKTLYPLTNGIEFIKHRRRIADLISSFEQMIKEEEIKEIFEKLYL